MATTTKYHSAICLVKDVGVMTTIVQEINKGVRGTKKEKAWSSSGFWFLSMKKHCDGYQEKFNGVDSFFSMNFRCPSNACKISNICEMVTSEILFLLRNSQN